MLTTPSESIRVRVCNGICSGLGGQGRPPLISDILLGTQSEWSRLNRVRGGDGEGYGWEKIIPGRGKSTCKSRSRANVSAYHGTEKKPKCLKGWRAGAERHRGPNLNAPARPR